MGTYSCIGTYSFGTNNGITSTPSDIMTLQNNIQITNDYPALSASFPEIIYGVPKTITQMGYCFNEKEPRIFIFKSCTSDEIFHPILKPEDGR